MASKRLKAAMSKKLAALQDNATDGARALGVHELFELASPSGSLVGFSIKGELSSGGREWEKPQELKTLRNQKKNPKRVAKRRVPVYKWVQGFCSWFAVLILRKQATILGTLGNAFDDT